MPSVEANVSASVGRAERAAPADYRYWGFISYSHGDEVWAKWVHERLERFPVPRKLIGRETLAGRVPKRLFPIFRDRDELTGADSLSKVIDDALRASRCMVVVCSPRSARSKYVEHEIRAFKAMGRAERIFYLIVEGEPGASEMPGRADEECFSRAARFRVDADGEVSGERVEPLAADARPGKDGRNDALLRVVAAVLDVGFDELKRRDQRRRRAMLKAAAGVAALALLVAGTYLGVADAGLDVPLGDAIRTAQDHYELSVFRSVRSDAEIRAAAASMRRELLAAIEAKRDADGWIPQTPTEQEPIREVWSHAQALTAVFCTDAAPPAQSAGFVASLGAPFTGGLAIERDGVKFGWLDYDGQDVEAFPALWAAAALAGAMGRPGLLSGEQRQKVEAHLQYTHEVLRLYRSDVNAGAWNAFPRQKNPKVHHVYASTLALFALIQTHKAGLPWDGDAARRDRYLRETAQWLVGRYDRSGEQPGWRGISEDSLEVYDGLTVQIYAELFRAEEAGVGFTMPADMREDVRRYLVGCVGRDLSYPVDGGECRVMYLPHEGKEKQGAESIKYLWWPWAIDCAQAWLRYAERHNLPKAHRVQVRRALGHLVVDLGPQELQKARAGWTYVAAEDLIGLGAIPVP